MTTFQMGLDGAAHAVAPSVPPTPPAYRAEGELRIECDGWEDNVDVLWLDGVRLTERLEAALRWLQRWQRASSGAPADGYRTAGVVRVTVEVLTPPEEIETDDLTDAEATAWRKGHPQPTWWGPGDMAIAEDLTTLLTQQINHLGLPPMAFGDTVHIPRYRNLTTQTPREEGDPK